MSDTEKLLELRKEQVNRLQLEREELEAEIARLRAALEDTNAALQHAQYPKVQEALRIIRKVLDTEGK